MQWVQICAVTSSVAEACSSAAVLLLRLQLYLCFSHHRNCDASTPKPARYSSVQAALCISVRAALGSLVQAGSPCRSCCPSAAWKQSQPAAAQAGLVHGVQVRKLFSRWAVSSACMCKLVGVTASWAIPVLTYSSGAAHCASPDVQKQCSNVVLLIPSAHTLVCAHTRAAGCLWAACSTAECCQLHRSPFALPLSELGQLEHHSHWNMTHETFTAL